MMKIQKNHYILVLFLLLHSIVLSQVKSIGIPEIRNYKRSDYKGGTQNWNIDQDINHNLYFANNDGLFMFDGNVWSKYELPNKSVVRSIKTHSSGKVFVGGYNEFGYFKPDSNGKLMYFSLSKFLKEKNNNSIDIIWKIHKLKNEIVFQSFNAAYIFKNNRLEILKAPTRFQFSFLVNNTLYFQDINKGIVKYTNGSLTPISNSTILNNTEVWGMFPLENNKIIISTLDKGLFVYQNKKITPWETEANLFIKKNSGLGGVSMKNNHIVLNSVVDGVIICDRNGKIIQHINRKKGLQNNTSLTSFIDKNNNLWLGLDNGISFVNENSPFTFFGSSYNLSTVYATIIHNNILYVATNQGVFYHRWSNPFKEEDFQLINGSEGQAWNLQLINGTLFCAHNRGAFILNGNAIVKTLDNTGYWSFKSVPGNPNKIIASNYNGFSLLENVAGSWVFKNQIKGFSKSVGEFEVSNANIWVKKDEYLYQLKFDATYSKFTAVKTHKELSNIDKGITSVQRIKNLISFQHNNHFYTYSEIKNTFEPNVFLTTLFQKIPTTNTIVEDRAGNIWYVIKETLGILKKNNNGTYTNTTTPFLNFTQYLVYNNLSINTLDSKNIFIGLTDGLVHYDSDQLNNINSKPTVFIQNFTTQEATIYNSSSTSLDKKITIPYASNFVKFRFSSPTFENVENIKYSYKLNGFDEDWSNWSSGTIKEYTNLREGKYTMNVKVKNSFGIISEKASVTFTISPPWYRHFIAYIFYLIFIVATIRVIRDRIKIKIRKNKYYETIEQRRLYLEKEARIRQEQFNLEKEIEKLKNDKLQLNLLTKDKELVTNSLQVVKKNKILNGIMQRLKDIDTSGFDETNKFQFEKLRKSILKEVNSDKSWKDLEKHIKNVHFEFLKRLKEKHPTITPRELDLSTYLLMNMSTKEISEIMNISGGGVELARYRLRKKLELTKKESLTGYLMSI